MRTNSPFHGDATPPLARSFSFDGQQIPFREGDTVAAALIASDELLLRRTAGDDDRGLFCGMGVCQECIVEIDGRPGLRSCMTPARNGGTVVRAPALPVATAPKPRSSPRSERVSAPDLLVVGGGPGGLACAAAAGRAGLDVVLVDERPKLGGQYFKQPAAGFTAEGPPPDAQFEAGRALIDEVTAAGVQVLTATTVWGAFAPDDVCAAGPDEDWRFTPRCLVIASGAYERGVPMPGWTLPGVITTGAAQTLWRSYGVTPGRRILVSGNGPLNMQVAAELTRAGAHVVALIELARPARPQRLPALARMATADPGLLADGGRYRATLTRARVPVLYGASVVAVEGEHRAERAIVASLDDDGRPRPGTERRFEVDAVCVGFGFHPSTELARALGARHAYDPQSRQLVTLVDDRGASSLPRVWVVGDGAGIGGARLARATGTLAGIDAAGALGVTIDGEPEALRAAAERDATRHRRFQAALGAVFQAPPLRDQLAADDTLICRCEGIDLGAVRRALGEGAGHVGSVKRATRAGMGGCQGRYCGPLIAELAARRTGEPLGELSGFAPNPPLRPIAIEELAPPSRRETRDLG
jgi:NADPH-dependent 2,4-dienoyl-CoA reductase/sulfur reductase-like enzyme